ncbi:DNA binding domain, excisionase family [Gottschalkia purinilytica]|uniref:DNA binding domain, excisionase family n=1 Tax=Gottschalkia purinilytica TaxID=1503 RepID=A0A0L0WCX7_GOTPU|nr:helix-turn-helix domain-containing protein [Gottschalkia purinilytica]KNF09323.1 DNA binding domain, excisionase family [Gottschalkia purinilytica]
MNIEEAIKNKVSEAITQGLEIELNKLVNSLNTISSALKKANEDISLYTVEEVSKILKSNPNTIYSLIREGKLQALKLGRYKIPHYELDRFLRDNLGQDLSEYIG